MDEPCRYARINISDALLLEDTAGKTPFLECNLKKQSKIGRVEIYQRLTEKGLEDDMASDFCPLAGDGIWLECPYYKPK